MAEHDKLDCNHNSVGIDDSAASVVVDEKRKMVNILEAARSSQPENKTPTEASSINNSAKKKADNMEMKLEAAQATCTMLEETVESFETRILESIAENGSLRQKVDLLQEQMFEMKAKLASMQSQRDTLRSRLEDIISRSASNNYALAAAEREISFLNARYQDLRLSKHN